ncbi:MAG: DUF4406 domain-containing protein [Patescibacteria group bacterium]|nr:DUF4406 domain-containing protein [Patescibacteria group bacterium]
MLVYLAGPMRGVEGYNFPAFDKARDLGVSLGYHIISPADMDRKMGFDGTTSPEEANLDPDQIMRMDIMELSRCDAIALLPGWESSSGARAELMVAMYLHLAVLDAETFKPKLVFAIFVDVEQGYQDAVYSNTRA